MGLLQLNAMRLADIFSDDSNFRSYMTVSFVSYHYENIKGNLLYCCLLHSHSVSEINFVGGKIFWFVKLY